MSKKRSGARIVIGGDACPYCHFEGGHYPGCPKKPMKIENQPKSWWPGDSRVEPFMGPVIEALNYHCVTREAFTDIYNRCYEAVYKAIGKK